MAFNKLKNLFNVDIKDGLKGSAVVQSSSMPSPQASSYNTSMWLDVTVEGRPTYRVRHECMVKSGKHPWPGATLPVVVDRDNPERIDIQWQELQTIDARMEGSAPAATPAAGQPQVLDLRGTDVADQIREALAAQGAVPGATPAGGGSMVEDRIAKLERISKLRESGVLSETEFEAEKGRILAGG